MKGFSLYRRLLGYGLAYWGTLLIGVIAAIALAGVDAGLSWSTKPIINQGFIDKDTALIHWLPILLIGLFVLRGAASFVSSYFIARVGRSVVMNLRQELFARLLQLPATFYDHEASGKLLSTLTFNVFQVATATTEVLLTVLREGLMIVGAIAVMLIVSWQLTLVFLTAIPFIAWAVQITNLRLRRMNVAVQETMGEVSHIAEEAIEGYQVIRTFGGETQESSKFNAATKRNRQFELKAIISHSLASALVQVLLSFPIAVAIYLATLPNFGISAGSFIAVLVSMLRMLSPMRRLTRVNGDIQKGLAAADSIFTLLDSETEKDTGTISLPRAKGEIVFDQVNFTYLSKEAPTLQNLSFSVTPGQMLALIGRSGAGKSTLVKLLARFYEPHSGSISIDGQNIQDYHLSELRQQFAFVSQDIMLFNDTIANNIAYGSKAAVSREQILEAADMAYATEFIANLPDGLDTRVGENGTLLSGGQRQRIAIARAILKDAPILILDEATSALDTQAEQQVQAALTRLMKKRTTLVIAHRLSTIQKADKILVLEKGQVVETGRHEELLEAKTGYYTALYTQT